MRNSREADVPAEPEKDLEGCFGDAIFAASRGGLNSHSIKLRVYTLPHFRAAAMHSPYTTSSLAYFMGEDSTLTTLRLGRGANNPPDNIIRKIITPNVSSFKDILRADLAEMESHISEYYQAVFNPTPESLLSAVADILRDDPVKLNEVQQEFEAIERDREKREMFQAMGAMDANPDDVEAAIIAFKYIQRAERSSEVVKRYWNYQAERRIRKFYVFAA